MSEFENVVVKAGEDGALVRVKDVGRVELGAEDYSARLRFAGVEASGIGIQLLPSANALETFRGVIDVMNRPRRQLPARPQVAARVRQRPIVREGDHRSADHPGRSDRARHPGHVPVPAELAQHDHPGHHDSGVAHRHLRLRQGAGLLHQHADAVRHRPGDRHRRGRCDRRDREHRAAHARLQARARIVPPSMRCARCSPRSSSSAIVLVAVFLPVAFFPGTTGRMYQQFSMTITFAVILSVFNAVTFTPALSALLLEKESHTHGRFFTAVNRVIDGGTELYVRIVRGALHVEVGGGWRVCAGAGRHGWVYQKVPGAFVPAEDEGYFFTIVQAPSGASTEYTTNIMKQVEADLLQATGGRRRVLGGRLQLHRRGVEHRPDVHEAQELRRARRPRALARDGVEPCARAGCSPFRARSSFRWRPRRSKGCRRSAASSSKCSIRRAATSRSWPAVTQQLAAAGNQSGRVAGLFSSFHGQRPAAGRDDRSRSRTQPRAADSRGDRRARACCSGRST